MTGISQWSSAPKQEVLYLRRYQSQLTSEVDFGQRINSSAAFSPLFLKRGETHHFSNGVLRPTIGSELRGLYRKALKALFMDIITATVQFKEVGDHINSRGIGPFKNYKNICQKTNFRTNFALKNRK